jgi:hypothetical protein
MGGNAFVAKPFKLRELKNVIEPYPKKQPHTAERR